MTRKAYWPEIEHFFERLPPRLFRQGTLLKNNLATFYAGTGQFEDILRREEDHYLGRWLLADLSQSRLENQLFPAAIFGFAAAYTYEAILDEGSQFDTDCLALAHLLSREADHRLAGLLAGSASFWAYHRACWQEYAEAAGRPLPPAAKRAYTKIPVAAITLQAGREELLSPLDSMLTHLNFIHQVEQDITTLRRDLNHRRLTYPLRRAVEAAELDPTGPLPWQHLLGALIFTGTVDSICRESLERLSLCRAIIGPLDLPAGQAYLDRVEEKINRIKDIFSLKVKAGPPPAFFAPAVDTVPKVIEMAEGYLLADPTFRESWEVQRRGALGRAEMTAKAFPAGLIVEILAQHGHDMSAAINMIFDQLQATQYRYFDYPAMPPDVDDLALLLRLYPFSTQPESHRERLQPPLGWLRQSVTESGRIPVWLKADLNQPQLALWGNRCVAVEANLLLGLIAYDRAGYYPLIQQASQNLWQRLLATGLAAAHHYVPLYSLWILLQLSRTTNIPGMPPSNSPRRGENNLASPPAGGIEGRISGRTDQSLLSDRAAQLLRDRLRLEASRPSLTPQAAAFLILAHQAVDQPPAQRWIARLCKSQRYDGSWAAEPLYGTPTRGELAAWYSSRSVTTAFCYHALKTEVRPKF